MPNDKTRKHWCPEVLSSVWPIVPIPRIADPSQIETANDRAAKLKDTAQP